MAHIPIKNFQTDFSKPAAKIALCYLQRGTGFMSNGKIIIVAGHFVGYSDRIDPLKDDDEPRR